MSDAGDGAAEPAAATFRLIYRSRDRIATTDRKVELGRLFSAARSNNKSQHITGALLLSEEWFVQTLEGEETAVRELFAHIRTDPRHDTVSVLEETQVGGRVFARWAMARVSEDGEPDIPLIAHVDGISPASSRGTTTSWSFAGDQREPALPADQ